VPGIPPLLAIGGVDMVTIANTLCCVDTGQKDVDAVSADEQVLTFRRSVFRVYQYKACS
jgi:hypothetical protein